jgi:hypothetical protein
MRLLEASASSTRSTGRNRRSPIRSTSRIGIKALRLKPRAARDWLFEHFPSRAASFIRPDNHASKRVVERLGAVCERTFELRGSTYEYWVHHRAGETSAAAETASAS